MFLFKTKNKPEKILEKRKNGFKAKHPILGEIIPVIIGSMLASLAAACLHLLFEYVPFDRKLASCNLAKEKPACVFFEENFSSAQDKFRIEAAMTVFASDLNRSNPEFVKIIGETEFRVSWNVRDGVEANYKRIFSRLTLNARLFNDEKYHAPEGQNRDSNIRSALGHETLHISYFEYFNDEQKDELALVFNKAVKLFDKEYNILPKKCVQYILSPQDCFDFINFIERVKSRTVWNQGDNNEIFAYGQYGPIPDFLLPYYQASLTQDHIKSYATIFHTGLTVEQFLKL